MASRYDQRIERKKELLNERKDKLNRQGNDKAEKS